MRRKAYFIACSFLFFALSLNLALYTSQKYAPPRAESLSYSVMDCPSHQGQGRLSTIAKFITGKNNKEGVEKHCFCLSCCSQRTNVFIPVSTYLILTEHFTVYRTAETEFHQSEEFYASLPTRSPPVI